MPKKSQIERGQTMQWTNEKEQKHKRLLTMLLNYLCYRSFFVLGRFE